MESLWAVWGEQVRERGRENCGFSPLPFQSLQSPLGAITPNLGASISLDTENSHYGTPSSCPAHTAPTPQTAHKGRFYELVCLFRKQKSVTYLKAPSYCSRHLSPTPLCALATGAERFKPVSLASLSVHVLWQQQHEGFPPALGPGEKRIKGRTGWPQQVWALELNQ